MSSTCVTRSGHVSGSLGQLSQAERCGCHSAGIWKPSAAGVFTVVSAIECFGLECFEPEVAVDADATDQHPESFQQQRGEIELKEQGNDYQAGADRVQH